ncbi:MAG: bifunctional folylpolyglutamate synthase/dihydrofolate synthase [Xanthomonadales bacterium]|nr:bifunctional folylpolyglutamate synthase/dihydrofolate synthase [Xanthomonadales bacterium]
MTPADDLAAWLRRLERGHPQAIALGLDRVGRVWQALGAPRPGTRVITVGGTNGKGSTVAFVEAAATAAGMRVGCYTSPHLHRYNERVRIAGVEVGDAALVEAFERVERAREGVPLTYFEAGTLAAFLVMAQADLDLAVLEVGLGGRLDAVNLIDAEVAVVTTVALDHQDWLGDTRAAIAREKAGIARPGRALVIGERDAEPALLAAAAALGAGVRWLGRDHDWLPGPPPVWQAGGRRVALPGRLPLVAPVQWDNAASALAALHALDPAIDLQAAAGGLAGAALPGRLQRAGGDRRVILDVAHNPQAATALAHWLADQPGPTDAVFSGLLDKDLPGVIAPLRSHVRTWHLAGLADDSPRGLPVEALALRVAGLLPAGRVHRHADVAAAVAAARALAGPDDRIVVFGSFLTVALADAALGPGGGAS